jgi:ABC-type multidrug transport system ATPase subunit
VNAENIRLAIRCRNLRKTYEGKVEALRGLDLEIPVGECFGLLGPNGAGKTTTIEILEGLLVPTSGEVEVLGRSWGTHSRELREMLGISLQETRLNEKLTVRETLELFASFYCYPRPASEVMEEMALTEKSGAWVGKLSADKSNAWQWPQPWWPTPRSCFSMSPPRVSIRRVGANSGQSSGSSSAAAEPYC